MPIDTTLPTNTIDSRTLNENQPIKKLSLFKRISRIFSDLYQKISSLFSRKPNPIVSSLIKKNEMLEGFINDLYLRTNNLASRVNSLEAYAFSHWQDISPRNSSFQTNGFPKRDTIYDVPIIKKTIKQSA